MWQFHVRRCISHTASCKGLQLLHSVLHSLDSRQTAREGPVRPLAPPSPLHASAASLAAYVPALVWSAPVPQSGLVTL
ncbi:uncharacterized protein HKW66_Vig0035650 [Vigna angularis]|uniref:Uncharacterized protein n=1 Tax=Phaseolus angularis TaxID=3914 RepID=A0A8T0LEX5_PHAAN|nr:uncharacterized protein HKW66_Vig0035650 [Vigna angularis]